MIFCPLSGGESHPAKEHRGRDRPNVFTVRNVTDIVNLKRICHRLPDPGCGCGGGGFIGIEVAENLNMDGRHVSVHEAQNQIMAPFDYDMVQMLQKELLTME